MHASPGHGDDIERVLAGWRDGDARAVDELFRLVYDELRVMAGRQARRMRAGDSVGPTVLVHEVYLRFADRSAPFVLDRNHFIALASSAMRMVLVDHWRRKHALKRHPGAASSVDINEVPAPDPMPAVDLLALDDALSELAQLDARQAHIVEMRFFGGLTLGEIAGMIDVSERTVKREWQKARAFLYQSMSAAGGAADA
jgi:RNA polymerase sigma factor (TIGR02999 family)